MRIYKYHLEQKSKQTIEVHGYYRVAHVGNEYVAGAVVPTVWIEVDGNSNTEPVTFYMFATGEEFSGETEDGVLEHVGTVQMPDGLVWHYYIEL